VFTALTIPEISFQSGNTYTELFEAPTHTAGTEVLNQFICGSFSYDIKEFVGGEWVS
jgi:hypothetical protein